MPIVLDPGGVPVVSLRMLTPYKGVWLGELDIDATTPSTPPTSGAVTLTITVGANAPIVLKGTVDPRGSGSFAGLYRMRVLGGAAGWDQPVTPQSFNGDAGVSSQVVYSAIARQVGETVAVASPRSLGVAFESTAGPASRVLDAEAGWWVDPITGVTNVGPRATATPDASMTLAMWDPLNAVADLTCDALVVPGTSITDARLAAPVLVRDVEQVFDAGGSRIRAWCGTNPVAQLASDLRSMVHEFSGITYARSYLYRIVRQGGDGRLSLQAVHKAAGVPDTVPITPWVGVSGASSKYKPGTLVRVSFLEGDKTQPVVDLYDGSIPLETTIDATTKLALGPSAALVALAGGTDSVVLFSPYDAMLTGLETFVEACVGSTTDPVLKAAATAFFVVLSGLKPANALKVTAE